MHVQLQLLYVYSKDAWQSLCLAYVIGAGMKEVYTNLCKHPAAFVYTH